MNPLLRLIIARPMPVTSAMDWLQERGLVSDNAVALEDVALCDCARVVAMAKGKSGGAASGDVGNGSPADAPAFAGGASRGFAC